MRDATKNLSKYIKIIMEKLSNQFGKICMPLATVIKIKSNKTKFFRNQ